MKYQENEYSKPIEVYDYSARELKVLSLLKEIEENSDSYFEWYVEDINKPATCLISSELDELPIDEGLDEWLDPDYSENDQYTPSLWYLSQLTDTAGDYMITLEMVNKDDEVEDDFKEYTITGGDSVEFLETLIKYFKKHHGGKWIF